MASPTPLSEANTTFSLALLKKFGDEDKTTNVFYSPFSISSALAMVMLGARGNTATQMSECLKTQDCLDDVHVSFAQLLSELNKADAPYALSVANRLYGEQSYKFVEDYLGKTKKHYSAELESVDFVVSYEAARLNINKWVDEQTQGKIKDLLAEGVVHSLTRLVLVNAIYFKGKWNEPFQESNTRDDQFRLNKNETKSVKMMHQTSEFPYNSIQEANCQILEMPYQGKELSMLIFLPRKMEDSTTGLEKLEKELTYENFVEWTRPEKMTETEVEVGLPRFKMEENYDMKNVLVSMGMVDAFDMSMSDFSGMAPGNDLVLSQVFHKAFVEVNEEGTEAAAATSADGSVLSYVMPITFIADHPFLFFIRHNPSMSTLFAGRYCSPKKIKDLLAEGVVDSLTRLVLVNAIYFKGKWNKQFQESNTRDVQFIFNKNEDKSVKMMHQTYEFPFTYIQEANCQILEMPYQGKELSMLIFLPNEIEDITTGLEKLEKELTYENFVEWTRPEKMNETKVEVGLPRFKMEEKYDMEKVLVSMGMVDAFDESKCDFSGMAPGNDLVLSKVVHKAFVEVNEEGTEVAAATSAIINSRSMPPTFIADHPFLFFIRHNPSMSILFAGRYCSPQ